MGWTLSVGSEQPAGDWRAEATRLQRQLHAVGACIATAYEEPLHWRSETMTAEQWLDADAIATEILECRIRDESPEQNIMPAAGSSGTVQGYRSGHAEFMVTASWSVGADRFPFNNVLSFFDHDRAAGEAKPLDEHSHEWLVQLLCSSATAVQASEAVITQLWLSDALYEARQAASWYIGALTLFPDGIGDAELPPGITAHPCPVGYPNGAVLVADLDAAVRDPESLVPALLRVHDLYRAQNPG